MPTPDQNYVHRNIEPVFFSAGAVIGQIQASSTIALISTGRCSPEPWRECSSMFLTMESARFRAGPTFEDVLQHTGHFITSSRTLPSSGRP